MKAPEAMPPQRSVDITPDLSLMEKLGSVGFAPEEALAEFVDNSIDALYDPKSGQRVLDGPTEVTLDLTGDSILVSDTSAGIEDFDRCMKTAWSEKSGGESLGEFGLGMKTAAMSLGRRVRIRSKRIGESLEHATSLDLDEWYRQGRWSIEVEDKSSPLQDHFTEISIDKLHVDPVLYLAELKERLAERFAPLIQDKEVIIRVNKQTLHSEPPRFLDSKDKSLTFAISETGVKNFQKRMDFEFTIEGRRITGWIDFLERRSPSGRFGFHVFRGRRLIQPHVKIGVLDHPNNSNLFGHIYLPHDFAVSFTKNRIEWRAGRFTMRAEMDRICSDHRRVATRMSQEKAPVVHPKLVREVTRSLDALTQAVTESPLIRGLFEEERMRALEDKSEGFGEVNAEVRAPKLNPSATRPIPTHSHVRNPNPEKLHQKKNFWYIQVGGFRVKLFHDWIDTDEPKMWYSSYLDSVRPPELHVQTNTSFDAYDATTDKMYYATANVIMALSRVLQDVLSQKGTPSPNLLDLQEELFLRWGRRISQGIQAG